MRISQISSKSLNSDFFLINQPTIPVMFHSSKPQNSTKICFKPKVGVFSFSGEIREKEKIRSLNRTGAK
jgi:hypothetical protein